MRGATTASFCITSAAVGGVPPRARIVGVHPSIAAATSCSARDRSNELLRARQIAERAEHDASPRRLVLVARADAALRRAERAGALLAEAVDEDVVRQDRVRTVGDDERPVALEAALVELVELRDEALRIDDHPLREHARRPRPKDPARDEAHDDLLVANDQRVPGVGAAAIAHDHLRILGVDVDDLPLPLVAPLRTYDHDGRHSLSKTCPAWLRIIPPYSVSSCAPCSKR
jgi:hypothetical protein